MTTSTAADHANWAAECRILDLTASGAGEPILTPFARDELLCRAVGAGHPPVVHLWRHPRAVVLGLRDSRLPHIREAADWLRAQGYEPAVRNSGGAAVPLDDGVVNVSVVLPIVPPAGDFRADFPIMAELIRGALKRRTNAVAFGEIAGAYCPGDYDVSIGGRKFCGISQRRQMRSFVLHAFVVARGSGRERAELAKRFYDVAVGEDSSSAAACAVDGGGLCFPRVAAASTASIDELLGDGAGAAFAADLALLLQTAGGRSMSAAELPFAPAEVEQMRGELERRYGAPIRPIAGGGDAGIAPAPGEAG
ncbi:MAG: lipoate--protein ligase family protein [Paenibacillaceae bacterium]|nr:lipoate--protein ligase family protein [Paenibacillaceae bacterium]